MSNEFYVYEYIRLDTNEPFYIGKGIKGRWKDFNKRNKHFLNIVNKVPTAVVILHDCLDEETAFEYECWYIWQIRDIKGFNLVNIDDGGKGGNTFLNKTECELEIIGNKISKGLKNHYKSEQGIEHKKLISEQHKGKKMSDESIEKWRKSIGDKLKYINVGREPWNKGIRNTNNNKLGSHLLVKIDDFEICFPSYRVFFNYLKKINEYPYGYSKFCSDLRKNKNSNKKFIEKYIVYSV